MYQRLLYFIILALVAVACRQKSGTDELSISYEKYMLENGLEVVLHEDHSDPMISYTIMYHVGSSRELPGRTGFAHLFEHMLFAGSENVPAGRFDLVIESVGGYNNGFTNRDVTTYFEVFPKNALEKVLWLESDRMGFFINSVTQRALAIQQNVVQNEKRQGVDNQPYGHTRYVIYKNLYPADHPYNWDVIGEMEDLQNAGLGDVKYFYDNFYGPQNATLVLAGDFHPDSVKVLVEKYFGEIGRHGEVPERTPIVPVLDSNKKLYHEDNFANVPEINMVWPVPQSFHKDAYALDFLARILYDGKKTPLYKVLVKEKELTSRVYAMNNPDELSGEFLISIRANEGKSLKEIEEAVNEAFTRFETEGITERDIERVKASTEKNFYQGIAGIFYKSLQLAFYNTFLDDPGFIEQDIANIKSVTLDDVNRVYNTYIKGKPHIVTSFVPRGKTELMADNSVIAQVKEENIEDAVQVEIADEAGEVIEKTPSSLDRSAEPGLTADPEVNLPVIWKATLDNGIRVFGIEHTELPLVEIDLVIDGGVLQDRLELPGVANMVASVMPQGTKNKTPEELEEEIKLLGADIRMQASREETALAASTLSRNFEKTVDLMKEILLEPRWDGEEFRIAQTRMRNTLVQSMVQPNAIAQRQFNKLVYGGGHIFGYDSRGSLESIDSISLDDLKAYADRCFSPSVTRIHVVGNVGKDRVLRALSALGTEWQAKEVSMNDYPVPPAPEKSSFYFVDVPGARQSVITIGYPAISRDNPDFIRADFINYRLGGAFTSFINQILREEKGFTYGARSYFPEQRIIAPFVASSSVRSDATLESVMIFKVQMEKYRLGVSPEDLQFIKDCMIRSNALRFETLGSLSDMLKTISKYGLADDYIRQEENVIRNMTLEDHRAMAEKYIVPDRMYWVVVGDAATQMKPLEKAGYGIPVLVKR